MSSSDETERDDVRLTVGTARSTNGSTSTTGTPGWYSGRKRVIGLVALLLIVGVVAVFRSGEATETVILEQQAKPEKSTLTTLSSEGPSSLQIALRQRFSAMMQGSESMEDLMKSFFQDRKSDLTEQEFIEITDAWLHVMFMSLESPDMPPTIAEALRNVTSRVKIDLHVLPQLIFSSMDSDKNGLVSSEEAFAWAASFSDTATSTNEDSGPMKLFFTVVDENMSDSLTLEEIMRPVQDILMAYLRVYPQLLDGIVDTMFPAALQMLQETMGGANITLPLLQSMMLPSESDIAMMDQQFALFSATIPSDNVTEAISSLTGLTAAEIAQKITESALNNQITEEELAQIQQMSSSLLPIGVQVFNLLYTPVPEITLADLDFPRADLQTVLNRDAIVVAHAFLAAVGNKERLTQDSIARIQTIVEPFLPGPATNRIGSLLEALFQYVDLNNDGILSIDEIDQQFGAILKAIRETAHMGFDMAEVYVPTLMHVIGKYLWRPSMLSTNNQELTWGDMKSIMAAMSQKLSDLYQQQYEQWVAEQQAAAGQLPQTPTI